MKQIKQIFLEDESWTLIDVVFTQKSLENKEFHLYLLINIQKTTG